MLNVFYGSLFFQRRFFVKTIRIMNLTAILLLACCLQISARGSSQGITLNVRNAPLTKVFHEIKKQTGYTFMYTETMLKESKKVSIEIKNSTLQEALTLCFASQPFTYRIINKTVVVQPKEVSVANTDNSAPLPLPPPPIEIHGRVVNQQGQPLQNVSVLIVGTNVGTATNADGRFTLTAPDDKDIVLEVSSVGYQTKRVSMGQRREMNVTLEVEVSGLNEVVVTALGIERKKSSLGYATQEVKGDELSQAPATNFINNLAGKVAGVDISSAGGVGSSSRITIRGESSLSMQNNQPLFVIDGVPVANDGTTNTNLGGGNPSDYGNSAAEINPNDIASLNVLKGPAAAALYGSRAANGAIVITTKKGTNRSGIGVSYNTYFFMEKVGRLPRFQNSFGGGSNGKYEGSNFGASWSQYPDGIEDGNDESWGPRLNTGAEEAQFDSPTSNGFRGGDVSISNRGDVIPTPWISHPNNVKDFFRQGHKYFNNVAVSGSNEKGNYRLSLTSLNDVGVIPNNNLDRYQVGLNSSYHLSKKLTSSINLNYAKQQSTNRPENGYGRNTFMYIFTWLDRNVNINSMRDYWQAGYTGLRQFQYNYGENHNNPFFLMYENTNGQNKDHLYGNLSFNYKINEHLNLDVRTGLDHYNDFRPMRQAVSTVDQPQGTYQDLRLIYEERNTDFLLTYKNELTNGDIGFNVSVGGNRFDQSNNVQSTFTPQLLVPGIYNLSNSSSPLISTGGISKKRINSLYALGTVNYQDLLYLSVTARNDWSSTLPVNHNSYFYPSVGLNANLKGILKIPTLVSKAQLRLGWAQVGNDAAPYQTINTYGFGAPWGNNYSLVGSSSLNNPDLKPELTATYEIGTAWGFLQNRLGIDITYYDIRSKNQIINLPLVQSSGAFSKLINAGEIKNTGIEVMLSAVPVDQPNGFSWRFNINWSHNTGRVESLIPGVDKIVQAAPGEDASIQARVGEKMGALWGPGYRRVPDGKMKGEKIIFPDGTPRSTTEDIYLGNINPDWIGSIYNQLSYKNFNIGFVFGGRSGGVFLSRFYNKAMGAGQLLGSEEGRVARPVGHEYDASAPYYIVGAAQISGGTYEPNSTSNDGTYSTGVYGTTIRNFIKKNLDHISEAQLFSGTYFKLREVSIGYTFSPNLLGKSFIKGAKLSLTGRNLLLFTPNSNKDFDPEVATATVGNGLVPGFENMSTPSTREMGVTLNLNF